MMDLYNLAEKKRKEERLRYDAKVRKMRLKPVSHRTKKLDETTTFKQQAIYTSRKLNKSLFDFDAEDGDKK